jgi:hypothetical protein
LPTITVPYLYPQPKHDTGNGETIRGGAVFYLVFPVDVVDSGG